MTTVVDYGVGNLYSIARSLEYLGEKARVSGDPGEILAARRLILPGVGAFGDAMRKLSECGLVGPVREAARAGKPLLGICLGMQMLFEKSFEYGEHEGLGLLPGAVCPIADDLQTPLKVPQIGWNALMLRGECPLLRDVREGDCVYFVHSYYAKCPEECVAATCEYGVQVPALVGRGNVFGAQFHPEKSGRVGLSILGAFCGL